MLEDESDVEEAQISTLEQRRLQAHQIRRAVMDHFAGKVHTRACDIPTTSGSVEGLPPNADDGRFPGSADKDEHMQGDPGEPKPHVSSLNTRHPGPRRTKAEIGQRDQQWIDVGSGI